MSERGQFSSAFLFVFVFAVLMFIFVFTLPMLQNLAVNLYASQEDIVADSLAVSNQLSDEDVKDSFQNTLNETQQVQQSNVEILGFFTIMGAIIIVIIVAAAIFLQGRTLVQQGGIG